MTGSGRLCAEIVRLRAEVEFLRRHVDHALADEAERQRHLAELCRRVKAMAQTFDAVLVAVEQLQAERPDPEIDR